MVGVAGKFKGCNTCRTRRVKCDNLRPHCKKCLDSGRECAGYDRERVFIVGTARDRGRCSSHPHRNVTRGGLRKPIQSYPKKPNEGLPNYPGGKPKEDSGVMRCIAISRDMSTLKQVFRADGTGTAFLIGATSLDHSNSLAQRMQDRDFSLRGSCLIAIGSDDHKVTQSLYGPTSKFAFLYDLRSSQECCAVPLKAEPGLEYQQADCSFQNTLGGTAEEVRLQGPTKYSSFPSHQFFSRIFRPHLCFHALTHRYPTFLSENEWCSIPWQTGSKSTLDTLFDILVLLPEIFARGEELEAHLPSITRRLQAKELLEQCTSLEHRLETWLSMLNTGDGKPLWWEVGATPHNSSETYYATSEEMLSTNFQFRDRQTAEVMLYYWSGQCSFYRAVQHIHAICTAEFALAASPELERLSYTDPTSTSPSLEFTPPQQQRQQQDSLFDADWSRHAFMPVSSSEQTSPVYDPALQYSQYLPDFSTQPSFPPDLPVEYGYETGAQSFLQSTMDFSNFVPPTRPFTQSYSPVSSTSQFYSYDPTTFIIPATPTTINTNIPISFPLVTSASSLSYPTLSPTYSNLLSTPTSNPSSRHNSTSTSFSRAQSFSISHSHPAAPPSYIHSRSPTPTHTALSSAPSSNPSLRNSISNPGSNPNSVGNGYTSTPPPNLPTSTSHPNLVDLGMGMRNSSVTSTTAFLPNIPDLEIKYMESNVVEIARKITRGVPFLLNSSTFQTSGLGRAGESGIEWEGGGAVSIALREAMKVFRRQGSISEVDSCKRMVEQAATRSVTPDVTQRIWREWNSM